MQITWVSINEIKPYEKNPRKNAQTVEKLTRSLKEYGWQQPLVVDKDNIIIVGHARWQAAVKLGFTEVPVHRAVQLTEVQARSYRLADNRLSEDSHWNQSFLEEELAALRELEMDLSLTGFRETELSRFLKLPEESLSALNSTTPVANKSISKMGDIWLLDKHRVMCGDAANLDDVTQLMEEQKADLIFFDPPYNVNYQGGIESRRRKNIDRSLHNDDLPLEAYLNLLKNSISHASCCAVPEASLYLCCANQYLPEISQVLHAVDFSIRSVLIWAKQHFVLNYGRYKNQHESILYCHRSGQTDVWYGDNKQSTLWSFDRPAVNDLHPTMKPIELVQQAIHNSSLPGDSVLDLFGGAGSTLMACEYNQRQAFIMEIMPQYVDVIVRRWQNMTQKIALSAQDGRAFPG